MSAPAQTDMQTVLDAEMLRIARGTIRELEAKVFSQDQALAVLRASVASYQRDMADPPGYLQDAVIRAAGLGALHEQRDAAVKERDSLRAMHAEMLAALRAMLDIHEQPAGFAGKYGKAITEAIAIQQTRVDSAVGMARAAIARAEGGAA